MAIQMANNLAEKALDKASTDEEFKEVEALINRLDKIKK